MLSLPGWLAAICVPLGVSLALFVARYAGKLCHLLPRLWLAIPLGVILGGASSYFAAFIVGRLIWPEQFFHGAVFLGSFSAIGGTILGGFAAGGLDLGAEVSSEGSSDNSAE